MNRELLLLVDALAREKNVPKDKQHLLGYGDIWTWTASTLTRNSSRRGSSGCATRTTLARSCAI